MTDVQHDGGAPSPDAAEPVSGVDARAARPVVSVPPDVPDTARVCEVALEEFEGPLDLLLHLVRRHELDILNIPIAFVCEKYLEYIEFMRALDLEVAGDYLVMAATLAYLKSRELVPHEAEESEESEEEDGPDPRQQLIARLLEYQTFKDAADRLDARPIAGRDTFGRGQEVELPPVDAGLAPITLFRLAEAYQRVLERARIHKSHEVVLETISVAARMEQLATVLIERSRFEFETLFLQRTWSSEGELRSMLVVTLMSILELVRMGIASVHQPFDSEVILVERLATPEEAREALAGYDEAISFGTGKAQTETSASEDEAEEELEAEGLGALDQDDEGAEAVADEAGGAGEPGPSARGVEVGEGDGLDTAWTDELGADEPELDAITLDPAAADELHAEDSDALDSVDADPLEAERHDDDAGWPDELGAADAPDDGHDPEGPVAGSVPGVGIEEPHGGPAAAEPEHADEAETASESDAQPTEALGSVPTPAQDAGAVARSVVSELPPVEADVHERDGDEATGSEADDEEHGENGEAEAGEGSQGP
ncbi:MAG: segregation/condensation protein A [Myxococcales bacterium]|nr:segregation/condensation protein A [Myxococcales bacterium]